MVIGEEGIPVTDSEISTMLVPIKGPEPVDHKELSAKSRYTKPIDLLYVTQDAYYVRTDSGKIVRFSSHVVGAVIFDGSHLGR